MKRACTQRHQRQRGLRAAGFENTASTCAEQEYVRWLAARSITLKDNFACLLGGHDVHLVTGHSLPQSFCHAWVDPVLCQPGAQVCFDGLVTRAAEQVHELRSPYTSQQLLQSSLVRAVACSCAGIEQQ